jgi:type VI secretion system secreted protein Hcp
MAQDIFAKIGDIKGESQDAKHKDEIEVHSFSWGVTNAVGGTGVAVGKASFKDIVIVHNVDKASPALMRACAGGVHIKDATIVERKAGKGQQEFLVVKLNDVIVTGVQSSADTQAGTEIVNLAFSKVEVEYRSQKADGSLDTPVRFGYDLKANKAF